MAGVLECRLCRPMSHGGESVVKSLVDRGIASTHVSELVAMAAAMEGGPTRPTQIIELKAVEAGYPFYGTLRLEPERPLAELLAPDPASCNASAGPSPRSSRGSTELVAGLTPYGTCHGAVVQESLLIRMGLSVGDRLKIGQALFTITGLLRREPDRAVDLISVAPRLMISREGLAVGEVVQPVGRLPGRG